MLLNTSASQALVVTAGGDVVGTGKRVDVSGKNFLFLPEFFTPTEKKFKLSKSYDKHSRQVLVCGPHDSDCHGE